MGELPRTPPVTATLPHLALPFLIIESSKLKLLELHMTGVDTRHLV